MLRHLLTAVDVCCAARHARRIAFATPLLALVMCGAASRRSGYAVAEEVSYTAEQPLDQSSDVESSDKEAQKWRISVIAMHNCGACERLKHDFAHAESLASLVDVEDREASWSHYRVYRWEDASHRSQWDHIHLAVFPTIVIQPPLSGKFGDPKTIVLQRTGYDGNDRQLAQDIRGAITKYMSELPLDVDARSHDKEN